MGSSSSLSPEMWDVQELVPDTCIEWRLPESRPRDADRTIDEGEAKALQRDSLRVLHFAPGAWLVINGDPGASPYALPSGLIGIDVIGKWIGFRLDGSLVESVLRAEVQPGIVLAKRHCAATSLFDCPVLLHRTGGQYELWVQASYSDHLRTQLAESAHRVAGQPSFRTLPGS